MAATLGDFLSLADEHITASVTQPGGPSALKVRSALQELARLVMIMDRHTYPDTMAQATRLVTRGGPASDRAVFGVALGLSRAARMLGLAAPFLTTPHPGHADPVGRHLRTAADSLIAGHDLVQTHFDAETGQASPTSSWATITNSRPVSLALAGELGRYADMLAPLADRLSATACMDAGLPTTVWHALRSASDWLRFAGAQLSSSNLLRPPSKATQLLAAIPANLAPPRHLPARTGSVPELCLGVSLTTQRLRHLAHSPSAHGRLSPAATSTSWRHVAQGASIATHNIEVILRALALRSGQLGMAPDFAAQLDQAADAAEQTWTSWRAADRSWDVLTTGTSRDLSPLAAEFTDLVVQVGRIARSNPEWTPARADASVPRDPTALAPDPSHLSAILRALLGAAAVIADTARRDADGVNLLARQRWLYIPTRLAPETTAVTRSYRFSQAPPTHIAAVLDAYATTIEHSKESLARLTRAALSTGRVTAANTPELAEAFRYSARQELWRRSHRKSAPSGITGQPFDQLQQALRQLQVDEPALMLRAAAIDYAAKDLVAQATASVRQRDQADQEILHRHGPRKPPSGHARAVTTASQDQEGSQADPRTAGHGSPVNHKLAPEGPYRAMSARSTAKPDHSASPASKAR